MVGICEEHLSGPVRTQLRIIQKCDSKHLQFFCSGFCVIDLKRKMMIATRPHENFDRIPGRPTASMFLDQMNQCRARLEPGTVEIKGRPRDFLHTEQADVKPTAGFNVAYDQCNVIDLPDLHGRR